MAKVKTKVKRASPPKSTKPRPKNLVKKPKPPPPPKIDISVRTIYHDGQHLPALCFRHHEPDSAKAVIGDSIVGIRALPLGIREHDLYHPVEYHGQPYPIQRFADTMLAYAKGGVPVTQDARALLKPLVELPETTIPDLPSHLQDVRSVIKRGERMLKEGIPVRMGSLRTSGKELIKELAVKTKLPPEKVRAKLRDAGLRAPYTDSAACHKALGVKT